MLKCFVHNYINEISKQAANISDWYNVCAWLVCTRDECVCVCLQCFVSVYGEKKHQRNESNGIGSRNPI